MPSNGMAATHGRLRDATPSGCRDAFGCTHRGGGNRPRHAQTLRIALREDADLLDPTLARTYVGRIVFAGLCDKLFDIDEKLQIVPQLATGYEWADPKTLLIHLRPGVLFQDGEKLDAAAVKYTLDRGSDAARQLPPQRDQRDRPRGRGRPADGARGAESASGAFLPSLPIAPE